MFWTSEADVLVAGAGPVGLSAALMLGERDIPVEVIDEREPVAQGYDYPLALHPTSIEMLDDLGVGADLMAVGTRVERVRYYDRREPRAEVRLDLLQTAFPFLLVVRQSDLTGILERRLQARKHPVHFLRRLSELSQGPDRVTATIEQFDVDSGGYAVSGSMYVVDKVVERNPRFVIGGDGYHSAVRRRLDIEQERAGAPISFASIELETDLDLDGEARVVLLDGTVSVLWPLPGGHCRWVLSVDDADIPPREAPMPVGSRDEERVPTEVAMRYIAERAPWFVGRPVSEDPSLEVHFEPGLARRFGFGRVWLAGDAAHVTLPIGVQSLNAGIAEAHALASSIARLLRGGGDVSLERYHGERTMLWRGLLGLSGPPTVWARNNRWVAENAQTLVACIPGTGAHFDTLAAQVGIAAAA